MCECVCERERVCVCVAVEKKTELEFAKKKVLRRGKTKSFAPASRFLHFTTSFRSNSIGMMCCHFRSVRSDFERTVGRWNPRHFESSRNSVK